MDPVTPTRVIGGRYVVLGELGRGGMGVVWRAEDRVMGRQVAVKELHLPVGLSPDERRLFRERLLREARTAGRLNSPGVVTVYDVVSDGGVDHIVMELIDARTLDDLLLSGPLDEREAVSVARQLIAALRTAHDNDVVHRDVKPSNVMIAADGHVTLTDFGIAHAADDPRLTATGSIVGSPGFLAPERLSGEGSTPASDMWALGATLYTAVTGTAPFARETTAATMSAVLHAEVPAVRTRGPLGSVIAGLLQRAPDARLTGVQAAALLAADAGPPPPPAPTMVGAVLPEPVSRPSLARRWRLPVVLPAVALVVGLVAGILLGRSGGPDVAVYTYGDGAQVPVFDVSAAGCVLGRVADGRAFASGAGVTCAQPHDTEVFARLTPFESTRTMPYPGADQLGSYAQAACLVVFDSAVVDGPDKATLNVVALVPGEAAFGRESQSSSSGRHSYPNRDVFCAVQSRDGAQLTGTRLTKPE